MVHTYPIHGPFSPHSKLLAFPPSVLNLSFSNCMNFVALSFSAKSWRTTSTSESESPAKKIGLNICAASAISRVDDTLRRFLKDVVEIVCGRFQNVLAVLH
mmetsp:Transcript_23725/g.47138  ORF Transcript_23725/g.47138 Transcript_23725/m.47138 type:complete len:101 (+) Transcript_23725:373-675(+)